MNELWLNNNVNSFVNEVYFEAIRASGKYAPMNSLHEGYAVILEELDELWEQVRKQNECRDSSIIHTELKQIAAMAVRTAVDLGFFDK